MGKVLKLANGKWKGSSMGLGSLDDVTASEDGGDVQSGDYLVLFRIRMDFQK